MLPVESTSDAKDKVLLGSFPIEVSFSFSYKDKEVLMREANLYFLGDHDCNMLGKDGYFVSKYPEKETEEFKKVHRSISCSYRKEIVADFYSDGTVKIRTTESNNEPD